MTDAASGRPSWESTFPGRMDWEMRCLQYYGATEIRPNQERLHQGALELDFKWPLRGKHISLRAVFPDAYDEMRPHVFLREPIETWPDRHVAPTDGNICLLGRDTAQWRPNDGLGGLLYSQLETALYGMGPEDPQGEPAEFWWNGTSITLQNRSYCLVDSGWNLQDAKNGTLELVVVVDRIKGQPKAMPRIRAVVRRVRGRDKSELAAWSTALTNDYKNAITFGVPWKKLDATAYPKGDLVVLLTGLLADVPPTTPKRVGDWWLRPFALAHPIELTEDKGKKGDGWIIGLDIAGRPHDFSSKKFRRLILPIYRAGKTDLGFRVPAFGVLAEKKIAVIGTGALGAPTAIELARNGVRELRLLDHDTVEPGNSVRWPLGAAAWGSSKVHAIKEHLASHYPGCEVIDIDHALGNMGRDRLTDSEAIRKALTGVDLVIDASASFGVNRLIWRHCRNAGLPLVRLGATPNVAGGTVSYHGPGGGCPVCIDPAREKKQVPVPPGHDDRSSLVQPPACGERTFRGAAYDLQELSLQAVRIAVEVLSIPKKGSVVYTLSLRDEAGGQIPPKWDVSVLDQQPDCPCQASVTA